MTDRFGSNADTVLASARKLATVTPHNSNELPETPKALYVGGAGTIAIIAEDDTVAVTLTVPAGAILPIRARIVQATGTTATGIVALL